MVPLIHGNYLLFIIAIDPYPNMVVGLQVVEEGERKENLRSNQPTR